MGQCMQQVQCQSHYHPSLGSFEKIILDDLTYFKVVKKMESQENYITWSKKINKIKSNTELKTLLYLPLKEIWKSNKNVFSCSELQLFFEPYQETLYEKTMNHKKNSIYFKEGFLWRLTYTLVKYLKFFQQKEQQLKTICFQNILVGPNDSVKITIQNIIPQIPNKLQRLHQSKDEDISLSATNTKLATQIQQLDPLQVAGQICLSAAALLDIQSLNQNNHLSWKIMNSTSKKEALRKCKQRYSNQLIEIFQLMLNNMKSCNSQQLIGQIQLIMPQVQLGLFQSLENEQKHSQIAKEEIKIDSMVWLNEFNLELKLNRYQFNKEFQDRSTIQVVMSQQNQFEDPKGSYLTIL